MFQLSLRPHLLPPSLLLVLHVSTNLQCSALCHSRVHQPHCARRGAKSIARWTRPYQLQSADPSSRIPNAEIGEHECCSPIPASVGTAMLKGGCVRTQADIRDCVPSGTSTHSNDAFLSETPSFCEPDICFQLRQFRRLRHLYSKVDVLLRSISNE